MNERFYRLPQKRQNQIINAAFRVFGESSYKKSPMSEVADAAGISKPLLFHYFDNKKGLYFYLWQLVADLSHKWLGPAYDSGNLFDMMRTGLQMLGVHSEEAVMVGDRMDTDVIAGTESGLTTVLVLSGCTSREEVDDYPYRPSYILNGVGDIAE